MYIKLWSTHLLLFHTDSEVTLVELIWNIPSQWPELSPFLYQSMEETQTKQELPPWLRFVTTLKELCV